MIATLLSFFENQKKEERKFKIEKNLHLVPENQGLRR